MIDKDTFFMVYLEGENSPTFKHSSIIDAHNEASRLARNFNKRSYVLQAISTVELVDIKITPLGDNQLPF